MAVAYERKSTQTRRLPPIGKCIYCGTTKAPLGREHPIPLGMGGDVILPEASCAPCAAVTGGIEQRVMRTMWGPFRTLANFPTRHPKDRPKRLKLDVEYTDGRADQIMVKPEEYPAMLNLPIFPPARALRGLPDNGRTPVNVVNWSWVDNDSLAALANYDIKTFHSDPVDSHKLVQMLAKIAHCQATIEYGVGGFQPLVLDLIFGRNECMNLFVGCGNAPQSPPDPELHNVRSFTHNEHGMILIEIRLFACLGAPRYHVVAGLKHGGEIARVI